MTETSDDRNRSAATGTGERAEANELLAHRYRRYLLYALYLYTPPIRLPDVADQITVWETGDPSEERLDERLRIYSSLYHDHIPLLADADVVDYDQAADEVDLGPRGDRFEALAFRELSDEVADLLDAERGPIADAGTDSNGER